MEAARGDSESARLLRPQNNESQQERGLLGSILEYSWIIAVSLVIGLYNIFGIYYLFSDYSVCSTVWLWAYCLLSIFCNILVPLVFLVCMHGRMLEASVVYFVMGVIGLIILYNKTCSAMESHGLYVWAIVTVVVQLGIALGALTHSIWRKMNPI
jgi:hypothetical protein